MKTTRDYIQELDEIKQMLRLNDRQMATRIGVSAPLLSLWRRGKAEMSNKNKDRIFTFFASPEVVEMHTNRTVLPSDPLLDYVNGAWGTLTPAQKGRLVSLIETFKTAALREKAEVNHKQALTRDQVRRLVEYCRDAGRAEWAALVLVGYYTGLRLKDAINLRRDQVQDGYIDLSPAKTARTGRRVRIPVAPQLAAALAALPLSIGNYFPELAALYQRCRQLIDKQFQRILCEAKLAAPGVGFHSLRHTFVTEALTAGIDLKAVQAVVGHVSETVTTGTYYHGETHADLSHYPEL